MRLVANNWTRWHFRIAVTLAIMFGSWTLAIVLVGLDHADERPMTVAKTVVGSLLGPLSGAISRDFQSCCLAFSVSLLPFCLTALITATAFQAVRLPDAGWARAIRLFVWTAGLTVWFAGGIVSFGHALG